MNFSLENLIMGGGSDLCSQLYGKYQDKLLCGEMSPEQAKPYMGKLGLTLCKIIYIIDRILNGNILTACELTKEENQKCVKDLNSNYTFVNLLTNRLDEIEKKTGRNKYDNLKQAIDNCNNHLSNIMEKFNLATTDREVLYLKVVFTMYYFILGKNLNRFFGISSFKKGKVIEEPVIETGKKFKEEFKTQIQRFRESREFMNFSESEINSPLFMYENKTLWEENFPHRTKDKRQISKESLVSNPGVEENGGGGAGKITLEEETTYDETVDLDRAKEEEKIIQADLERDALIKQLLEEEAKNNIRELQKGNKSEGKKDQKTNKGANPSSESKKAKKEDVLVTSSSNGGEVKTPQKIFEKLVLHVVYSSTNSLGQLAPRVKKWNNDNISFAYIKSHPEKFPSYQDLVEPEINREIQNHCGHWLHKLLKPDLLKNIYTKPYEKTVNGKLVRGYKFKGVMHLKTAGRVRDENGVFELGISADDGKIYHCGFVRNLFEWAHVVRQDIRQANQIPEDEYQAVGSCNVIVDVYRNIRFMLQRHPLVAGYTIFPQNQ